MALPNVRSISIHLYLPVWRYSDYCEQQLLEQFSERFSGFLDSGLAGAINVYRLPLEADMLDREMTTLIVGWSYESKAFACMDSKANENDDEDAMDDDQGAVDDDPDAMDDNPDAVNDDATEVS